MKFLPLILLFILLNSCTIDTPDVELFCELDQNSTYIIKWDYAYAKEGFVEIYTSTDPENFSKKYPIGKYDIRRGFAEINMRKVNRPNFFLLSFNEKYDYKLGLQCSRFDSIQNYRDIGGYRSNNGKRVKWAKIYRSGTIANASSLDVERLKLIKPISVVDLRTVHDENYLDNRNLDVFCKAVSIPFDAKCGTPVNKIFDGKYRTGDAAIYMQDIQLGLVENGKKELRQIFDILLDESSYPVVFIDAHGMHQINFAIAMVLASLDIPVEVIQRDAMLSNKYLDKAKFKTILSQYSEYIQCVATTLLTVEERYLNSAFVLIRKKYGSIDNYLSVEIGLTKDEKEKLKDLLLD